MGEGAQKVNRRFVGSSKVTGKRQETWWKNSCNGAEITWTILMQTLTSQCLTKHNNIRDPNLPPPSLPSLTLPPPPPPPAPASFADTGNRPCLLHVIE
ncbi:hypothetical protein Q3G72_023004 [Acer saccharum]|nr:hypothetical protein Q3G72_023004 [Acer saccharum]